MTMDYKKSPNVFILISNATISPQLLEIIKCLKSNQIIQHIFIIADEDSPLLSGVKELDVSLRVLRSATKSRIFGHSLVVFKHLLKHRPKTVLASGQFATFIGIPLAFMLRIKNRIHVRHHSNFHHRYKMRLGLALDNIMNKFSTKIVAVSRVVRDILVQREGVPVDKVSIIHNGVDLQVFNSETRGVLRKNLKFRIGVISRLTEWKGVAYTARAFQDFLLLHPNSYLHIIGANADDFDKVTLALESVPRENYQIESLNLDIPGFLKSIDVLVHVPLEVDDEAFGIVYIEALASGTPGIFTISGVLNELNNPDLYFSVVPSRDQNAILGELEKHFTQSAVHQSVPADWLKQFSLEYQGLSYLKLLS